MASQFDIDCRHYGDRELGTARLVDISDHQESAEHHRQQTVCQTTNSPPTETSHSLTGKARDMRRKTDKFHDLLSKYGPAKTVPTGLVPTALQYVYSNCLVLLTLGIVAIGIRTCALLLRLKSIFGCSRNRHIGKFPALQCVWKHVANSTVQPKYPELERGQFLGA